MSAVNLEEASQRVERLLEELRSTAGEETATKAESLVRTLLDLYGVALGRILQIAGEDGSASDVVVRLTGDRLVASLLVLHGLHPVDVDTRIQNALDTVRPYLGSHAGGVEYRGIDAAGVVRLRLQGSCSGCPSSTVSVKLAVERAIMDAAPEITRVEAEGVVEETSETRLLQIGMRPKPDDQGSSWAPLDGLAGLLPGSVATRETGGVRVLVCSVNGTLYAYRDACAVCDASLGDGTLTGEVLVCCECGARYDVRLAGRSADGSTDIHLEPLPLLPEHGGWKVAVPQGAAP
ncbi:MAG: NifU family protein [Actinomycetota bacterium]